MTSAQVVETSVKVTTNSPSQDYTHPDDHNLLTYDMTPGFKPFTRQNSVGGERGKKVPEDFSRKKRPYDKRGQNYWFDGGKSAIAKRNCERDVSLHVNK